MAAQVIDPEVHPLDVVSQCLAEAAAVLEALPEGSLPPADAAAIEHAVCASTALERRVRELRRRLSRTAELSRAEESSAATDTGAWLARLTGSNAAVMRGGLRLARLLQEHYPAVRQAFASGGLGEAHARIVVEAAEQMPSAVTDAERDEAVAALVEAAVARRMSTRTLRRRARRMLDLIDKAHADEHEAVLVGTEEQQTRCEVGMTLHDNGDGTYSGAFTVPASAGSMLQTHLEHLSSPRRVGRNKAGERVVDQTIADHTDSWAGLSYPEPMGWAMAELCEHLPTDGLVNHGRTGATIAVHIGHQHLLDGLAAAHLDTGVDISASEARRLACNAGIMPIVYGKDSVPLDAARESRLHNKGQRIVISHEHDTCTAEGCERPFAWCELHHPIPWAHGGRTDLNGIPLCGWHHHRAHDDRYDLRELPTGEVRFRRRR